MKKQSRIVPGIWNKPTHRWQMDWTLPERSTAMWSKSSTTYCWQQDRRWSWKIHCRIQEKYPAIGATKIHRMLRDEGITDIPCPRTINDIFKRNGLITKEASQIATPYVRFEKVNPMKCGRLILKDILPWETEQDVIRSISLMIAQDSAFAVHRSPGKRT